MSPSRNHRFLHNAVLIGIAEMIARARALIVLPLIAHRFGADGYGLWSQVIMLTMLLTPLVLVNSPAGIVRKLSGVDSMQQKQGFLAWILFVLTTGVFFTLSVYLFRNSVTSVFFPGDSAYVALVPLAAANIMVTALPQVARTWFRLRNDAIGLAALPICQSVLNVLAVVIGIFVLNFDLYDLVLATILIDLVLVGSLLLFSLNRAGWERPNFSILRSVLAFSLPMLPNNYAVWGLNWLDRFFVLQYRGIAEVGVYAAASSLGYVVIQIFANPVWSMYPAHATELYRNGTMAEINRIARSSSHATYALIIPSAFGFWVLGHRIMLLLGDPIFLKGVPVIPLITIAYLVTSTAAYHSIALGFVHRQRHSTIALLLALTANVVLNFVLIPRYGILGAAVATLAAFALQLAYVRVMARRMLPEWRGPVFPAGIVAASALMASAVAALDHWTAGSGVFGLALLVIFGAVLTGVLFIAFGVVSIADIAPVLRSLMRRVRRSPAS